MLAIISIGVATEHYLVAVSSTLLPLILLFPVESSLGLFALMIPFDSVVLVGQQTTWTWLVGAFTGAIMLLYGLISGRLQRPPRAAFWWALFVFWASATVLWAANPLTSIQRLSTVMALFAFYLVIVSFRVTKKELANVLLLAILGGVLSSVFTLKQFAHGTAFQSRASLVYEGQEANPNDFAATLIIALSFAIGGFLSAERRMFKAAMMAAIALLSLCMLLTMSRGALFAVGILLLVFLIRTRFRLWLLAPILCLLTLVSILPDTFFMRINESLVDWGEGRLDIWIVGLQIIKHHSILGVGLDNFPFAYNTYAAYAPVFRGFSRAPHNIYLQVWTELGLVGLGLFATAVISQVKQGATIARESRTYALIASEAACYALLAHGVVANLLWRKAFWMSWILLTLMVQLTSRTSDSIHTGFFRQVRAEASSRLLRQNGGLLR